MSLEDLDRVLPQLVDQGLPGGGEFLAAEFEAGDRIPALIALLIWHGFLPMGGMGLLLAKIHKRRCLLDPVKMHIGKTTRRRAKSGFRLTVDAAWPLVVDGIQRHTFTNRPGDCWLTDEVASAYLAVNDVRGAARRGVSFHSVELWHEGTGELAAGEIGYTCGGVYSSCTGFTLKDAHPGAGAVQLAALGRWLARSGFQIWDLGMELEYKKELGGEMASRADWAKQARTLRQREMAFVSPDDESANVYALITSALDVRAGDEDKAEKKIIVKA